jgi:hypothetical protein
VYDYADVHNHPVRVKPWRSFLLLIIPIKKHERSTYIVVKHPDTIIRTCTQNRCASEEQSKPYSAYSVEYHSKQADLAPRTQE